jgi:hypothetical protein
MQPALLLWNVKLLPESTGSSDRPKRAGMVRGQQQELLPESWLQRCNGWMQVCSPPRPLSESALLSPLFALGSSEGSNTSLSCSKSVTAPQADKLRGAAWRTDEWWRSLCGGGAGGPWLAQPAARPKSTPVLRPSHWARSDLVVASTSTTIYQSHRTRLVPWERPREGFSSLSALWM